MSEEEKFEKYWRGNRLGVVFQVGTLEGIREKIMNEKVAVSGVQVTLSGGFPPPDAVPDGGFHFPQGTAEEKTIPDPYMMEVDGRKIEERTFNLTDGRRILMWNMPPFGKIVVDGKYNPLFYEVYDNRMGELEKTRQSLRLSMVGYFASTDSIAPTPGPRADAVEEALQVFSRRVNEVVEKTSMGGDPMPEPIHKFNQLCRMAGLPEDTLINQLTLVLKVDEPPILYTRGLLFDIGEPLIPTQVKIADPEKVETTSMKNDRLRTYVLKTPEGDVPVTSVPVPTTVKELLSHQKMTYIDEPTDTADEIAKQIVVAVCCDGKYGVRISLEKGSWFLSYPDLDSSGDAQKIIKAAIIEGIRRYNNI